MAKNISNRQLKEIRPGANVVSGELRKRQTAEATKKFIERVSGIAGSTPEKIQQYFNENNTLLRRLYLKVGEANKKIREAGIDPNQRVSRGHYARLSHSIDSPRNLFLELLTENIGKGDKYSPNPAAMLAIGNPVKEGIDPIENWARDFTTWLDKPENGGSGVLPQRGDYSDLLEQKFNLITGEQWDKLDPTQQKKAINVINDLTSNSEKLNQFLPSEGAARRKWGLLTPDQAEQAKILATNGIEKNGSNGAVTELGEKLGGIGEKVKIGKSNRPNFLNKKKLLFGGLASAGLYSAINPTSAHAAGDIAQHGVNGGNIQELGGGIASDIASGAIMGGLLKGVGKAANGLKINGALNGAAKHIPFKGALGVGSKLIAPLSVGWAGYSALDELSKGFTGANLKEIGQESELNRANGSRREWRHGGGATEKVNALREKYQTPNPEQRLRDNAVLATL